jgi:hypothetical protein
MPWCPLCKTEYDPGIEQCVDCEVALVESLPPEPENEPVIVLRASTVSEARVAEATLKAEGIPAFIQAAETDLSETIMGEAADYDVYVPAEMEEKAREVLSAPPPTLAELTAAEENNPLGRRDEE